MTKKTWVKPEVKGKLPVKGTLSSMMNGIYDGGVVGMMDSSRIQTKAVDHSSK